MLSSVLQMHERHRKIKNFTQVTQCMCLQEEWYDVLVIVVQHLNHRAVFPCRLNRLIVFFSLRADGQLAEHTAAAHPCRPLTAGAAISSSLASWPREAIIPLDLGPGRPCLEPGFASPHTLHRRDKSSLEGVEQLRWPGDGVTGCRRGVTGMWACVSWRRESRGGIAEQRSQSQAPLGSAQKKDKRQHPQVAERDITVGNKIPHENG